MHVKKTTSNGRHFTQKNSVQESYVSYFGETYSRKSSVIMYSHILKSNHGMSGKSTRTGKTGKTLL